MLEWAYLEMLELSRYLPTLGAGQDGTSDIYPHHLIDVFPLSQDKRDLDIYIHNVHFTATQREQLISTDVKRIRLCMCVLYWLTLKRFALMMSILHVNLARL